MTAQAPEQGTRIADRIRTCLTQLIETFDPRWAPQDIIGMIKRDNPDLDHHQISVTVHRTIKNGAQGRRNKPYDEALDLFMYTPDGLRLIDPTDPPEPPLDKFDLNRTPLKDPNGQGEEDTETMDQDQQKKIEAVVRAVMEQIETGETKQSGPAPVSVGGTTGRSTERADDLVSLLYEEIAHSVGALDGTLFRPTGPLPTQGTQAHCFTDKAGRLIVIRPFSDEESAVRDGHELLKWADSHRQDYPDVAVVFVLRRSDSVEWLERAWEGNRRLKLFRPAPLLAGK